MFSVLARAAFTLVLAAPGALALGKPVAYQLGPASSYSYGCLPPCLCPIAFSKGLAGTFELSYVGSTANWFDVYRVLDVDWVLDFGKVQRVTGAGRYEIGGQVALMQRLELDLSIDGGPVRHFDSGLVPVGATFPDLQIAVALNGFYCFDEVFDLEAIPLSVGTPYCTSVANSSGEPATIRAFGSAVVADDDLTLVANGCPPQKPAVFFFGAAKAQAPFGDGFLCVGPPITRIPPALTTGFAGTAVLALELGQPPLAGKLVPGTTWHFQLLFRDPPGGAAGFNLSDGLAIDFQ